MSKLSKALEAQEDPPCVKFECKFDDCCKRDQLACEAFHHFVNTGNSVAPTTRWEKGKPYTDERAYPTEHRYAIIYFHHQKHRTRT